MPITKSWTPERVAQRVRSLAAEHGAPNRIQLHEVANDTGRAAVLAERIAQRRRELKLVSKVDPVGHNLTH